MLRTEGSLLPYVLRPDGARIYYEVAGDGPPLLALAPGDASSGIERWAGSALGSYQVLQSRFTVIVMDQRHAGRSRAPLAPFSYNDVSADQLAVLDAAGVPQADVLGVGIGANYALKLAYEAPARVRSIALVAPIGAQNASQLGNRYQAFNDTIRIARAGGLAAVVEAAMVNPCFLDNPAAGPWAPSLHHDADFRDMFSRLSREYYISEVVDFRDGIYPAESPYFSVNEVAIERLRLPILVIPGEPADLADGISARAPNAECCAPLLSGDALLVRAEEFFARNPRRA